MSPLRRSVDLWGKNLLTRTTSCLRPDESGLKVGCIDLPVILTKPNPCSCTKTKAGIQRRILRIVCLFLEKNEMSFEEDGLVVVVEIIDRCRIGLMDDGRWFGWKAEMNPVIILGFLVAPIAPDPDLVMVLMDG